MIKNTSMAVLTIESASFTKNMTRVAESFDLWAKRQSTGEWKIFKQLSTEKTLQLNNSMKDSKMDSNLPRNTLYLTKEEYLKNNEKMAENLLTSTQLKGSDNQQCSRREMCSFNHHQFTNKPCRRPIYKTSFNDQ